MAADRLIELHKALGGMTVAEAKHLQETGGSVATLDASEDDTLRVDLGTAIRRVLEALTAVGYGGSGLTTPAVSAHA